MLVRSADGEKLGKVVACQPGSFVVEKGFLFPKDTSVPYDRIADIRNGEIHISLTRAEIGEGPARTTAGAVTPMPGVTPTATPSATANPNGERARERAREEERAGALDQFGKRGEIHVSLAEEEVIATKHVEKVGEVHVRKEVITEEKQITVPVTREVLRVERVAVSHEVRPGDKVFVKESYDIPISEEHVSVEKRPVVREEITIGKEVLEAEEIASASVRRERAEIQTEGAVRREETTSRSSGMAERPAAAAMAPKR
jgi:uncharacterized protein (TIGR02271 family)